MNSYPMTVVSKTVTHPADPSIRLSYHLLPFPAGTQNAWSILAVEEEPGCVLETRLIYDLTRDPKTAMALFRLCVNGQVLPNEMEEVLAEQEIR